MALTALPNLHPAVVHFPIALLIVAVVTDLAALVLRRRAWIERTAVTLVVMGAAGAWVAVLTGTRAADSIVGIPPEIEPLVGAHHDWADRTAWLFTFVALARLAALLAAGRRGSSVLRVASLVLGVVGLGLLVETADRGGALVYVHGLAVTTRADPVPTAADSMAATGGTGPTGAESSEVTNVDLQVAGRAFLLLPGDYGDVTVEAELDLANFRGRVGPFARMTGDGRLAAFEVATEGIARLCAMDGSEARVLAEGRCELPRGLTTLALSSAGRHWKGMVDGATTVHGHEEPPGGGRVGLLAEGEGVVHVRRLRVVPLTTE